MLTRKIDMERLTVVSSKPFDAVVSAVEQSIGHPNIAELGRAASDSTPFSEFEPIVNHGVSASGLMLFMKLDAGGGVMGSVSSPFRVRSKPSAPYPNFCSTPRPRILPLHPDVSASYQQATSGRLNRPNNLVHPGSGYFVAGGRNL